MTSPEAPQAAPLLRILNPDATPEEIAAIVAVLTSLPGTPPAKPRPHSPWSSPAHRLRIQTPGPGAWRTSGLPN